MASSKGYGRKQDRVGLSTVATTSQLQRISVDNAVAPVPLKEAREFLALHGASSEAVAASQVGPVAAHVGHHVVACVGCC